MPVDKPAPGDVIRRLQRAEGQLHGVIAMVETGRDWDEVLTQLAAVSHAVNRAAYLVTAERLRQCASTQPDSEDWQRTVARLEKSFLSLA